MIYAITGLPGSGKSMYVVRLAKRFLERGYNVYSNIIMDFSSIQLKPHKRFLRKTHPIGKLFYWTSLSQFRYIHRGIVIIDEAGSYFEPRQWQKFDIQDRIKFQQHRKQLLDIYLTTQSFTRIDAVIRQLTAFCIELRYRKMFRLFSAKTYIPEYINLKKRRPFKTERFFLNRKLASCYDTLQGVNLMKLSDYAFMPMLSAIKNNKLTRSEILSTESGSDPEKVS